MPAGTIQRVHVAYSGPGGGGLGSFYFHADDASADCEEAVGTLLAAVDGTWSDQWHWATLPTVDFIDTANGQITSSATVTGHSGGGGSGTAPVPTTSQVLFQLRTGVRVAGREIRGRMYIPGLTEGANNGQGAIETSTLSDLQGWVNSFVGDGDTTPVVWSRKNGTYEDIDSITVWGQWAVLRSRRA